MPEYYSGDTLDNHRDAIETATATVETDLFIGGEFCESEAGERFETRDPTIDEPITSIARGRKADIDNAVSVAEDVKEEWGKTVPSERQDVLRELAERVRDNIEEFTLLESLDSGKPLDVARGEIERGIKYLEYYAG